MSTIRLEYDYASSKAKTMEENASKVEKILTDLVADMETNINSSTWKGDAADSFRATWNRSADGFTRFVDYMRAVQSKVDVAAKEAKYFDENS